MDWGRQRSRIYDSTLLVRKNVQINLGGVRRGVVISRDQSICHLGIFFFFFSLHVHVIFLTLDDEILAVVVG